MLKYNRFVGEIWMWMIFLEWIYECFTCETLFTYNSLCS